MPSQSEKHLYEYAVIRYVPRVEREEFINVGLIMMCKRQRWIRVQLSCDEKRISALFPGTDIATLTTQLNSFKLISQGKGNCSISTLDAHERFRWLTAVRSASISTSRPHPGITSDLDSTFDKLFSDLVL